MVLDQTANMSVCFHDQKKSELYLNIHNRHNKQTGQKVMADLWLKELPVFYACPIILDRTRPPQYTQLAVCEQGYQSTCNGQKYL